MELTIATFAFIIMTILLLVVLVVEYIEYRRYRRAAQAVIAFGEGMQVRYNEVVTHLQAIGMQGNKLRKAVIKHDKKLSSLQEQQTFTGMAVNSIALTQLLQQGNVIGNGEDTEPEIQGA